jgi:hypothetical protein
MGGSFGKLGDELVDLISFLCPKVMSPTTRAHPPEPVGRDAHGPRARLQLPQERPNHLLGIADLRSIAKCVPAGVDTFDSAFPSRNGRHGSLLSDAGVIKIGNAKYAHMHAPVMPNALQCDAASSMPLLPPPCASAPDGVCAPRQISPYLPQFSAAYLHHLQKVCSAPPPPLPTVAPTPVPTVHSLPSIKGGRSAAQPGLPSLGRARTLLLPPPPPCSAALRIRRSERGVARACRRANRSQARSSPCTTCATCRYPPWRVPLHGPALHAAPGGS